VLFSISFMREYVLSDRGRRRKVIGCFDSPFNALACSLHAFSAPFLMPAARKIPPTYIPNFIVSLAKMVRNAPHEKAPPQIAPTDPDR